MTRRIALALLLALAAPLALAACGAEETTEETPMEEPPPPPPPAEEAMVEPEPEPPAEVPDCPEEGWAVAANGPNRATTSGVEAAGWARSMGSSWSSLRVCRTADGSETRLSCAPIERGAECMLAIGDQRCTATLPQPLVPAAVGQLIDTGEQPTEGTWRCGPR